MVTICLSTYNGAQFLREQLLSLENQTYNHSDLLLLARDDGSDDECYEILCSFANQTSLQVEVLEGRTNLGIKKSFELLMNRALDIKSDYIMFCDQDDIWHSDKVEKLLYKMQQVEKSNPNSPILVHSDLSVADKMLNIQSNSFWKYQNIDPSKNTLNRLIMQNVVTGCAMMINYALASKVKTIPKKAIMHDWWIALVASVFGTIEHINEPLTLYRQHGGNDTGAKLYGWRYVANKFLARPVFDKYIEQAATFLEVYKDELSQKWRTLLEDVARLKTMGWVDKRATIIRHKIFKNGISRNIGVLVYA